MAHFKIMHTTLSLLSILMIVEGIKRIMYHKWGRVLHFYFVVVCVCVWPSVYLLLYLSYVGPIAKMVKTLK